MAHEEEIPPFSISDNEWRQYHPDVCGDRRSQQIFQEILNERAEILERMAKE